MGDSGAHEPCYPLSLIQWDVSWDWVLGLGSHQCQAHESGGSTQGAPQLSVGVEQQSSQLGLASGHPPRASHACLLGALADADAGPTEQIPSGGLRSRVCTHSGFYRKIQLGWGEEAGAGGLQASLSTLQLPFWVHTRVTQGAWELLPSGFPRGSSHRSRAGPLL